MNDEEKVFSVSEMFYVEIESWQKIDWSILSEKEKQDFSVHLQTVILEAKEILDKPRQSDDE